VREKHHEPRYRGIPIRWRLALISSVLTLLILSVFAFAVGELTTDRIRSDFNGQLATAADDLQNRASVSFVAGFPKSQFRLSGVKLDDYAGAQHAAIRVMTQNGVALFKTKQAPDLGLYSLSTQPYEINGYRVAQRTVPIRGLPENNVNVAVIQYARKISDVDATVSRVQTFLILGVIGGTLVSLLGGLVLARRAMRPIDRLTTTAREIAETQDPSQRIPQPRADDEVAELARTLDDMLRSLEEAREETEATLERQRRFVADASHELRTPLTSVLVNLELLADVLEGERGEAARSALRSSRRMRRLVQDLLLLARADARRQAPHEPLDLGQVVVDAAAELEPVAGEHRLTVDATPDAWVNGVRDDLHRVALNLMENAMKHTPPGTHVRATVTIANDDVVLSVADDGPGIPPELKDKLFERFVRGAGDAGGSSGLGLAIVRAVATTHGGTVDVEDAHPGARFVVRLPRIAAPARGDADRLWSAEAERRP
jgi:two-component system, OmpR family, sensor kinase